MRVGVVKKISGDKVEGKKLHETNFVDILFVILPECFVGAGTNFGAEFIEFIKLAEFL